MATINESNFAKARIASNIVFLSPQSNTVTAQYFMSWDRSVEYLIQTGVEPIGPVVANNPVDV